jgi:hypothetical protein
MATRFYFQDGSAGAADVSPAYDSGWSQTTVPQYWNGYTYVNSPAHMKMFTQHQSVNAFIDPVTKSSSSHPWNIFGGQFVSEPINGAQTITGTVKGYFPCYEWDTSYDLEPQVSIRVVSNDGATVRGTLLALQSDSSITDELSTSATNRAFPKSGSTSVSSVSASDGDRIVIEVGFRSYYTFSGAYGYISVRNTGYYGGADCSENETDTDYSKNSWVELSATLFADQGSLSATAGFSASVATVIADSITFGTTNTMGDVVDEAVQVDGISLGTTAAIAQTLAVTIDDSLSLTAASGMLQGDVDAIADGITLGATAATAQTVTETPPPPPPSTVFPDIYGQSYGREYIYEGYKSSANAGTDNLFDPNDGSYDTAWTLGWTNLDITDASLFQVAYDLLASTFGQLTLYDWQTTDVAWTIQFADNGDGTWSSSLGARVGSITSLKQAGVDQTYTVTRADDTAGGSDEITVTAGSDPGAMDLVASLRLGHSVRLDQTSVPVVLPSSSVDRYSTSVRLRSAV